MWINSDELLSMKHDYPSHTREVFSVDLFRRLVDRVCETLCNFRKVREFNAVAGCGQSGIPLCGAVSYELGIPMIAVRKAGEPSVAWSRGASGAIGCGPYVVLEDLIGSGQTMRRIMDTIHEISNQKSFPVGIVLYSVGRNKTPFAWKGDNVPVIDCVDPLPGYERGYQYSLPGFGRWEGKVAP